MLDLMLKDGDIVFDNGTNLGLNFSEIDSETSIAQTIYCRLKSCTIDWFYDDVGADLEQLLGEPNTEENANRGSSLIINSLTKDGLISEDNIVVKPIPIDNFTINYYVAISLKNGVNLKYEVSLALNSGISIKNIGDIYA